MTKRSLISPEGQGATFVELFFDLVFVFAITQITSLLHGHLDFKHVAQALLIFWLIWWSWTQFTWTLNNIDTTNTKIELITLISTGMAFFMAITIPEAFGDRALLFSITYIITRSIGLSFQIIIPEAVGQDTPVKRWVVISVGGLLAVLMGSIPSIAGSNFQYFLWSLAIVLDLSAAASAGSGDWTLRTGHFAERHGLIVIIALGESLIVAAAGLNEKTLNSDLIWIGIFSVLIICGLWWSYFIKPKPILEEAMEAVSGNERAKFARDVYSLSHFPMLSGIVAIALFIEESIAHPGDILPIMDRITLAVGMALFLLGSILAVWRAIAEILYPRLILTIIGSVIIISNIIPVSGLLIGIIYLITILGIEHVFPQNIKSETVIIA